MFGSVARRAFGIGSDTDLLVISADLPAAVRGRIDLLGDHRDGLGEIDPVGWTEAEWERRVTARDPFAELLVREGIPVMLPDEAVEVSAAEAEALDARIAAGELTPTFSA